MTDNDPTENSHDNSTNTPESNPTPEGNTPSNKPDITNPNPGTAQQPATSQPSNNESTDNKSDLFGPSDDELQKELHKYAKALREEFARATDPDDRAQENVEKYTRDFFKKNLASACAQIVWLSANSTSDSVRLNACKTIVHEALASAKADGDPIKEILASLQGNTPREPAPVDPWD